MLNSELLDEELTIAIQTTGAAEKAETMRAADQHLDHIKKETAKLERYVNELRRTLVVDVVDAILT
jgi:hypothetical protein